MKIAIDTNSVYVTHAGTTRYVLGLFRGLKTLSNPGVTFIDLAWRVNNFGYRQPQKALKTLFRETIWSRCIAPRRLAATGADLLHRCTPSLPIKKPRIMPEVVTLYDLAILRYPERFRRWHRFSESRCLPLLNRADKIICISRFTANEAINLTNLPASRLEVIYPGNDFDKSHGQVNEICPQENIPDPFFLFVGSLEPGKNLALLKDAYSLAKSNGLYLPPLVIVGARWEGIRNEGSPPDNWLYLGHQPDEILAWLYQHALALLFPSKYEGFGFPPLEAMSCGCPVICSPVASLPEVCGNAAMYVEMKTNSYLEAMKIIGRENSLRQELVQKGLDQAKCFSWTKCALETLAVYHQVLIS